MRLLGLRHVVVAVNKMDLLGFDESVFIRIRQSIELLAETLGLPIPHLIPVSALKGDNVVSLSEQTPWYAGPSLLDWLESVDTRYAPRLNHLRIPVQYVARQDGSRSDDFRGYLGQVESGLVRRGQKVVILPSGQQSTIAEIHISNGEQACVKADNEEHSIESDRGAEVARQGQSVVLRLADDVDVSRGDLIVAAEQEAPVLASVLGADVCWLDETALSLSRKYLLQHGTRTVFAKVRAIEQVLDIQTLSHGQGAQQLRTNEIGQISLVLQKPVAADLFDESIQTGSFVLIDEATKHTVAAGMIRRVQASTASL